MSSQTQKGPNADSALVDRRSLLRGGAVAAAAVALGGGLLATPRSAFAVTPAFTFADIPGAGDVKVLNYALALEDLEADLYAQALMRLTTGGKNKLGKTIKGLGLSPNAPDVFYTKRFGKVEAEHRDFLRSAISAAGAAPITQFKYDFKMETLTRRQTVELLYTAEKTGVSAYLGAIPKLTTRTYLQTAGAIQGTEARHTAVVAITLNSLFNAGLNVAPLADDNDGRDGTLEPDAVLAAVSPFIVV